MTQEAPVPTRNQVTVTKFETHLRGPWLVAVRVAWVAVVGLALVALVVALPLFYQAQRTILTPERSCLTS